MKPSTPSRSSNHSSQFSIRLNGLLKSAQHWRVSLTKVRFQIAYNGDGEDIYNHDEWFDTYKRLVNEYCDHANEKYPLGRYSAFSGVILEVPKDFAMYLKIKYFNWVCIL